LPPLLTGLISPVVLLVDGSKKTKGTGQSARTIVRIAPKRRKYPEESTARSIVSDISVTQMTTDRFST